MKAIRLKTEYLKNPRGIDYTAPRLSWNCEGGVRQTACRIVCKDEAENVLWDSGKVETDSMHTTYAGVPLQSRSRVAWQVCLWDENDAPGDWSDMAVFELGLLHADDWQAQWITGDYTPDPKRRYPVDCFKKAFTAGKIKKARLYATACGVYRAAINGKVVEGFVLAPGHTDYRKRVQYQTYDVTALLREGENELTVQLADGWYRGSCGANSLRNQYGTETKLLAQLELTLTDGTVQRIVTDGSWLWSNDGPIRFADNKDGERFDARRTPSYSGHAKVTTHSVQPTASDNEPMTEHERLTAKILYTPSGKTVLDFGQNIAGILQFSITAKAGQRLHLRFGEMLDKDGEFTQKNIQSHACKLPSPMQQIDYVCKDGRNDYKTAFAIFGFQYMLVESEMPIDPADFTAIAVYTDMERTGWFTSSNELLDKFFESTVWSAKNNHADLPTDCPTRERHGWAGDAQIFCPTACLLFDYAAFARKYERDLCDVQRKDGRFTQIAPLGGVDSYMNAMDGSAGWSDAGVLIPWDVYEAYGDRRILEENYDAMCRYARYKIGTLGKLYMTSVPTGIDAKHRKDISNYGQSYGEWAEPIDVKSFSISEFVSPHPEETTAYIVFVLERMAKIAKLLGHTADAQEFSDTAQLVRKGYQYLVATKKHSLDTDRQAKLVRPLYMKLLNKAQTNYARKRLIQALDNYGWRLGTGFLSTPFILDVLADIDLEYAYRLLENEELPGWLCMPKQGATTIWENWEGPQADDPASLNHYSKGAVCEWLFRVMCGIRVEAENHFTITPRSGGNFTYAEAEYLSVYGRVTSAWRKTDAEIVYTITVPANCTAVLTLPGRSPEQVSAGSYTVKMPLACSK